MPNPHFRAINFQLCLRLRPLLAFRGVNFSIHPTSIGKGKTRTKFCEFEITESGFFVFLVGSSSSSEYHRAQNPGKPSKVGSGSSSSDKRDAHHQGHHVATLCLFFSLFFIPHSRCVAVSVWMCLLSPVPSALHTSPPAAAREVTLHCLSGHKLCLPRGEPEEPRERNRRNLSVI